ncbi:MAG: aspartate 1-decarboxylase [Thermodesulfobacterium geofontis]|uniref:Aspartate 1-decarboxylase n=1 Tax=Thermodesulfobacterium geofontis TaxID=1295609 RepID=A0A2N7Q6B6_9BACT|nr:MAG: aspartate 1-decarboxylase [Thermodesulfobacterium geofontis]PMP93634.1 MAG: aspartate 1-decarboxylase [Thermodesulfobacterium geofontis]
MLIKLLKSKIHLATITGKNLFYEGSLTLDREIMEKAGLKPLEAVWVYNLNNGERFETYVIEGNKGEVILNGAAARLGEVGDKIIIVSYAWVAEEELKNFKITLVYLEEKNEIKEIKTAFPY